MYVCLYVIILLELPAYCKSEQKVIWERAAPRKRMSQNRVLCYYATSCQNALARSSYLGLNYLLIRKKIYKIGRGDAGLFDYRL